MNQNIVLKFGGTSVGTAERIKMLPEIIRPYLKEHKKVIVVCSALSKVTDLLIKTGMEAAAKKPDYESAFHELLVRHHQLVKKLFRMKKNFRVQLENTFDELNRIYRGIYLTGEFTPRMRDLVSSFGERLSCSIITEYFNSCGLKSAYCDARPLIKTNNQYGEATVDFALTYRLLKKHFSTGNRVSVVTGFISSAKDQVTTTLGRGGSDYTAAIIGAALRSKEIHIWTDVNGVMSADPNKVKDAITISRMTYNEAMEMCYFGAKVIHPPTILPALEKKIPLRIKNSFAPAQAGTLITHQAIPGNHLVKGITSIENITMLTLQGSGMVGVAGISARLFGALAAEKINVILITQASSEHNVSLAVKPEDAERAKSAIENSFALEIKTGIIEPVNFQEDLSILAVIGEDMKNTPGVSGRLFRALGKNGISVVAAAQGSSELNISVVVHGDQLRKALNCVHDAFFLADHKTIHVFIAGVGLIGSKLIEQMMHARHFLMKQHGIRLNISGISDSRKMLLSPENLSITSAKKMLQEKGTALNESLFIQKMIDLSLSNSIFVDCTSTESWSKLYRLILANSISIVTPNKTANSGSQAQYNILKDTASKHNVKFLYETNVGAGLPVINTLNNLLISGDKVLKIEAVLSGTLSYIFNSFNPSTRFSDVVKSAKEMGYTEPDPRDDLSGKDFARKLLILARESGATLEMKNISIANILPADCIKARTVNDFFVALKNHDGHFSKLILAAEKKGKVLRMIGTWQNNKAVIGLRAVDASHPFYNMSGSDNIVAFTTNRYKNRPLVVKGPGAGAEVTAAGVLADIISISNYLA